MSDIVDGILALVVIESVGLAVFHAATGRGVAPGALLANLLAGLFLLLAIRFAIAGTAPPIMLSCLALAGIAHLGDLRGRWQRS